MKAIILDGFGGVEHLIMTELPTPVPAENDVLVQVKAISINPVDVKTRAGKGASGRLKDEKPIILGWDISGIVTESKSPLFSIGDEVFGMVNFPGHGKAYAEYVVSPASHLGLKPASISHTEAAAASLAALTAWQAIVSHAGVQAGQRVLVHAAAGGVGHFAVQIAKQLGAYVIGTSSAANREFVLSLGADEHIDYKAQTLAEATHAIDFVLDAIGGDTIDESLDVLKPGGTIISIPSGRNEAVKEKAEAKGANGYPIMVHSSGEDMKKLADLLEKGTVKAHVSQTFAFDQMGQAHLQIETGKTQGKIAVLP
ncbi:NADP-dependent oxidoreductase [Spirosoma sp. KNUC1025]|uniref:NADP-dependent oxidoreductase n=1 Tax=Spirosoma sp. KNUC1025 TaxID=2894082 RepID=UPI0038657EC0|nr:NADP-dependent oxidoreductase [Spirosoma sp. KNUC1025]